MLLDALFASLILIPVAAIAFGTLAAGYLAYRTRVEREEVARMGPVTDPAVDLPRLREELLATLAESRAILERTRDAVHRGTKG